ncbi:MAG: non-ribosomal peptide synthetase, partial [Anaerolineaceae bacterium]
MKTLVDLLERSAVEHADRQALVMRAGVRTIRYSYSDLEQRAHAYARLFREQQVGAGDRVVIWGQNQPDWVVAMFGVFVAGAIVVPLDVRSSRTFVEGVIEQTSPKLALAGKEQAVILRELGVPVLEFGSFNPTVDALVTPATIDSTTLAEIIFTSGTTGDPKGVMLSHGNILANVIAGLSVIDINRSTRMLSLLPLSHMFEQIGGCFAAVAAGAAVAYPSSRQPAALSRTMQEWKPTFIMGVPQVLTLLMNGIEREADAHGKLKLLNGMRTLASPFPERVRRLIFRPILSRFGGKLDLIASGGAAIAPEVQLKWEAMGVAVVEGYGTTECAPIVTINPRADRRVSSVGRPLPGQEIRVSADGEVQTRGLNVFGGYWNNQAATAAAFDGDWYRTGDLGYIEDGYLYLKGRKKDLIVLADGQNVYPEDVEDVLRRQAGVTDAVVFGLRNGADVKVHAVVLESEPGSASAAVRSANGTLDDRQQIRSFSTWPEEDFPRTHTLKVRRPLVEAYLRDEASTAAPLSVPASDADVLLRLVAVAARRDGPFLETHELGADVGLDSLGRVELLSAIEDELGVYVDDTEVGARTTVALSRTKDGGPNG